MRFARWFVSSVFAVSLCADGVAWAQQPVPYQGLEHSALGGAQLFKDPGTGELFISNIGPSGQDGVAVALPRIPSHTSEWTNYRLGDPGRSGSVESTITLADGSTLVGPSVDLAGVTGNIIEITGFNGFTLGTGAQLTALQGGRPTATFDLEPGDLIQFDADPAASTGNPIDTVIHDIVSEPNAMEIRFGDGLNGRLAVIGDTVEVADADALELRVVGRDLPSDAGLSEVRYFPGEATGAGAPLIIVAECVEGEALAGTGLGNAIFEDLNANGVPTDGACDLCRLTLSNIGATADDGVLFEPSATYLSARGAPASGGEYTFAARPGGTGGLDVPVGGTFVLTYNARAAGVSVPGPIVPTQEIVFDNAPGAREIRVIDRQPFGPIQGSNGTTTLELLRGGAVVQTQQVGITDLTLDLLGADDRIDISRSTFDANLSVGGNGGPDEVTRHTFGVPITVAFGASRAVEVDSIRIVRDWVAGQFFSYEGANMAGTSLPDGITLDTSASGSLPRPEGGIPATTVGEAILTSGGDAPFGTGGDLGVLLRGIAPQEVDRGGGPRFELGTAEGAGAAVRGMVSARAKLILLDEPTASEPILSFEIDPTANGGQGGGIMNVRGDVVVDHVRFAKGYSGELTEEVVVQSPVFPLDLGILPIGVPLQPDFDFSMGTTRDPGGGPPPGASAWFSWPLARPTALPGGTATLADELTIEVVVGTQPQPTFDRYANLETSFFPDGINPQTGEPIEIQAKLLAHEVMHVVQGRAEATGSSQDDSIEIRNLGPSGDDGVDLELGRSPAAAGIPGRRIRSVELDLGLPGSGLVDDPFPGAVGSEFRVEWTGQAVELRGFGAFSVKKRAARSEITLDDLAGTPPDVTVSVLDDGLLVGGYTLTGPPYAATLDPDTPILTPQEMWIWSLGASATQLPLSSDDEVTLSLRLPVDVLVTEPGGPSQAVGDTVTFSYTVSNLGSVDSARVLGVNLEELRVEDITVAPEKTGTLYAADLNTDQLFTIDPGTAATAVVGSFGPTDILGMAYDEASDTLYASSITTGQLLVVDRTTGAATPVGPTGFDVTGMAWDPTTSTLFAVDFVANVLLTIDPVTGAGTSVGPLGFDLVGGLAFDPNSGTLYGVDFGTDELITIDPTTGAGTAVGPVGFINVASLAFDAATDTLYAVDFTSNELLTIDPTTGAGSLEAGFSGPTLETVRGMAFVPEPSVAVSLVVGSAALALLSRRQRA